ncbi:hypothetical protein ACROYT_G001925 [Oculina patagonica]
MQFFAVYAEIRKENTAMKYERNSGKELLQNNEISLQRQRSVCEMDLAALKLKQEACQFGQFLKANPVEE